MAEELSLYRRWRPKRFAEVVGQELVVATLKRAVAQGKLHHAYLFAGQRGVGKTTLARLLARAANCGAPQEGEPCNRCPHCLRILSGQSLDVVEIDGASHRGIDQVRQLREEVAFLPAGARYKVYIIDEVHMLTQEAFNALLKTLEEPPPHVLFIFATTEPHKVPPTVLSRCQAFWLQPIPEALIAAKVAEVAKAEGMALESGAAEVLAQRAGGSLRDALVLLEQLGRQGPLTPERIEAYLGLPPRHQLDRFLGALLTRDADTALSLVEDLAKRGQDLALFVEELLHRARDRAVAGEVQFLPLLPALLALRTELPRAFSRRLRLEIFVLEHCGPPQTRKESAWVAPPVWTTAGQGEAPTGAVSPKASPTPPPADHGQHGPSRPEKTAGKEATEPEDVREKLVRLAWHTRADLGVFLAPADFTYADGILRLILPEGYRYPYESLQEREVRAALEEVAHQVFSPLLAVEIAYVGNDLGRVLSLEEAAKLLAEKLEGEIISSS